MVLRDSDQTANTFLAVLAAADRVGATVTRTKLVKLLYLADLRAMEKLGRRLTAVHWRWLHHGPFDNNLFRFEDALVQRRYVRRETNYTYFGDPEYRLSLGLEAPVIDLEEEFSAIVSGIVEEFGSLAASTLRDITYQTLPMLEAQQGGLRGVDLDLDSLRPLPDVTSILARLRDRLHELGEQETDAGAVEQVEREIESTRDLRARANRKLLVD